MTYLPTYLPTWPSYLQRTFSTIQTLTRAVLQFLQIWTNSDYLSPFKPLFFMINAESAQFTWSSLNIHLEKSKPPLLWITGCDAMPRNWIYICNYCSDPPIIVYFYTISTSFALWFPVSKKSVGNWIRHSLPPPLLLLHSALPPRTAQCIVLLSFLETPLDRLTPYNWW